MVPNFVQTDDKSFVRDTQNHALLNTDRVALHRNRAARLKSKSLTRQVADLEAQVSQIRDLLHQLLNQAAEETCAILDRT